MKPTKAKPIKAWMIKDGDVNWLFTIRETRKDCIKDYCIGSGYFREWKEFEKRGRRCVRVTITEL